MAPVDARDNRAIAIVEKIFAISDDNSIIDGNQTQPGANNAWSTFADLGRGAPASEAAKP